MEPTINRQLWLLTGRQGDFVNPDLNAVAGRSQLPASPAVTEARHLLHLNDTSTDFYVVGAMAALLVFHPDGVVDRTAMFLPLSLAILPPSVTGASLRSAGQQHPSLLHRPTSLPVARRWYITYLSTDTLRVTTDHGYARDLPYRLVTGVIYVDWPTEIGFDTALAPVGGVWTTNSTITITCEPVGYPYVAVAESIKQSHDLIRLLADTGNLTQFHAAQSALQKVGALAAAVVQWGSSATPG